jgi:hypothetical protein
LCGFGPCRPSFEMQALAGHLDEPGAAILRRIEHLTVTLTKVLAENYMPAFKKADPKHPHGVRHPEAGGAPLPNLQVHILQRPGTKLFLNTMLTIENAYECIQVRTYGHTRACACVRTTVSMSPRLPPTHLPAEYDIRICQIACTMVPLCLFPAPWSSIWTSCWGTEAFLSLRVSLSLPLSLPLSVCWCVCVGVCFCVCSSVCLVCTAVPVHESSRAVLQTQARVRLHSDDEPRRSQRSRHPALLARGPGLRGVS